MIVKGALPLNGVGVVVSNTVTVKVQLVVASVGMPEKIPVVFANDSPVGGQFAAFEVDQLLYVEVPPVAPNFIELYSFCTAPFFSGEVVVMARVLPVPLIMILKGWGVVVAAGLAESVTDT